MDLVQWTSVLMTLIFSKQCGCSRLLNDENQYPYYRIRRNVFSCTSTGINISDSIPEGLPVVSGIKQLEDKVDRLFMLPCYAYSRTPANVSWLLNDGSTLNLEQQNDNYCKFCIKISHSPRCSQELQIKHAAESNSGIYTCVVTNKYGTKKFQTKVKVVQPRVKLLIAKIRLQSEKQKAILGGSIVIICTIHNPKTVRGIWLKNGKRAVDDGKRLIWNTTELIADTIYEKKMYLHLKNITAEDEGNYTCFVKGGMPVKVLRKTLTLKTVPCPAGHYCPWTENQAYPCPYGTYTNDSSNGTVLTASDCLLCPGIPQDTQPKGEFEPATSLGHCPAAFNSCAVNHYCPNRMSKIPCPSGSYFEGRNASKESDCKKCPNDEKELSHRSAIFAAACSVAPPNPKRQDDQNSNKTEIVAGLLGGITFVFVAVLIIASFYFKRRAQTSRSLYKSNFISPQVALEKFHKKSCPHHQDGYTFDPSNECSLLAAQEEAIPTLYDVFVTYSSMDGDWVKNLVSMLESRGLKCCVDYRDFLPGNAIVTNIAEAIYQSKRTLAILSPDFIKSNWCQSELHHALARVHNHKVVPVLYRACTVPIELKSKTYIDWENPDVKPHFWDTLERALKEKPTVCSCILEDV